MNIVTFVLKVLILQTFYINIALVAGCAAPLEEINGPTEETLISDNTKLVIVSGRKGVTQPFLAITPYVPENVKASVILFAGDTGYLGLDEYGSVRNLGGNFLVKSRNYFVQQGMVVAVVDVPSDRRDLEYFRTSRAHAVDIRAVIDWLRKTADVPVWLVGTSRGTISVAGVSSRLIKDGPDGIVLTSTVFGNSRRGTVYGADLSAIEVPVLVVHHKKDACESTPYLGAALFMGHLSSSSNKELIAIDGGLGNMGSFCGAMSPHGFLGLERKVVKIITDWIKAN